MRSALSVICPWKGGPRGLYNEHFLKKSIFANPKIEDYDLGPTVEAQARGLSTFES